MSRTQWQRRKLGEVVELTAGFPFRSQEFSDGPTDIPLVKGENVSQGRILWDISKRWRAADWTRLGRFHLCPGDIVVAMDRPWVPAGLKWAAIRDGDPPALLVQRCARLRSKSRHLEQSFLRYVIGGPAFEAYIIPITSGVNVPHVSGSQILDYEFALPAIEVQRWIVEIASPYDHLVENCQRRIEILETMASALYREWFAEFRFPGHEHQLRVPTPFGAIPCEWAVRRLPECAFVNPRVVVPKEGEKPFVPMQCLASDSMLIADVEARAGNSGSKFQNGDTLVARITPCLENGKTGFVQFLPAGNAVAFGSTEFIVLRSDTLTPHFVYLLARSERFRSTAIKSMSGATGRQRVQERCFDDFLIAQPPRPLLDQFSGIVAPMFSQIQQLHRQIENLRATRDLLLPRLLSGQLALPETEAAVP